MDTFLAQLEHDILDMDWLDDFPQTETSDLGLLADHTRKFFETYTRKYETHITRVAEEVQRKNSADKGAGLWNSTNANRDWKGPGQGNPKPKDELLRCWYTCKVYASRCRRKRASKVTEGTGLANIGTESGLASDLDNKRSAKKQKLTDVVGTVLQIDSIVDLGVPVLKSILTFSAPREVLQLGSSCLVFTNLINNFDQSFQLLNKMICRALKKYGKLMPIYLNNGATRTLLCVKSVELDHAEVALRQNYERGCLSLTAAALYSAFCFLLLEAKDTVQEVLSKPAKFLPKIREPGFEEIEYYDSEESYQSRARNNLLQLFFHEVDNGLPLSIDRVYLEVEFPKLPLSHRHWWVMHYLGENERCLRYVLPQMLRCLANHEHILSFWTCRRYNYNRATSLTTALPVGTDWDKDHTAVQASATRMLERILEMGLSLLMVHGAADDGTTATTARDDDESALLWRGMRACMRLLVVNDGGLQMVVSLSVQSTPTLKVLLQGTRCLVSFSV